MSAMELAQTLAAGYLAGVAFVLVLVGTYWAGLSWIDRATAQRRDGW